MNFRQILLITAYNTQIMKQQKINNLYQQMKQSFQQLDQAGSNLKTTTEKLYLKSYMNVMERMSLELHQAKERYRNLDRERLKNQKCQKLAEDIRLFRQECYSTKNKLQCIEYAIKKEKLKEDILIREQQALKISLKKVQERKNQKKVSCEKMKSYMTNIEEQLNQFNSTNQLRQKLDKNNDSSFKKQNNFISLKNTKQAKIFVNGKQSKTRIKKQISRQKQKEDIKDGDKKQLDYFKQISEEIKIKSKNRPNSTRNYYFSKKGQI